MKIKYKENQKKTQNQKSLPAVLSASPQKRECR